MDSLGPSPARAHVCMDAPISRVGSGCSASSPQKRGPCGVNMRGTNVTTFRPGETITVALNETIDHPSHYRIAFNPDGDTFEDPTSKDDKTGAHPFVLLDDITDESAAKQTVKVTLPKVTCERCTLQLIQVMYDKGSNGFGGNDGVAPDNDDVYYACADIVLEGEPVGAGPGRDDAGTDAGQLRDAATPVDGADDDKRGDTNEASCALAGGPAQSRGANGWLGWVGLALLVQRLRFRVHTVRSRLTRPHGAEVSRH
ncbi:MAG TPA: SCE4755 family polysaccharide monooxygenase-like protein [Polyangiales bacterium]